MKRILVMGCGLSLLFAACSSGDEPEVSPSPSPTTSPTPTLSPSPEPWQIVDDSDVAVLERLITPTTGETWHSPIMVSDLGLLDWPATYAEVGTRGDATIVLAVEQYADQFSMGYAAIAMFEIDPAGVRMILCPSTRATDMCAEWSNDWLQPGRSFDTTTHYDSLTYPLRVHPVEGWTLNTGFRDASIEWIGPNDLFGHATLWPGMSTEPWMHDYFLLDNMVTVVDLGDSRLVETSAPGPVPGSKSVIHSIVTPFGTLIPPPWGAQYPDYGLDAVTWDDGVETFVHPALWGEPGTYTSWVVAAAPRCSNARETVLSSLDTTQWLKAGTNKQGRDVYLPSSRTNPVAVAVFNYMRDNSWGDGVIDGIDLNYRYANIDAFLADRSLFAWDRGDGTWALGMDDYARNAVYECA